MCGFSGISEKQHGQCKVQRDDYQIQLDAACAFFVERLDGCVMIFVETSMFDKKDVVRRFRNETVDPTLMEVITLQNQPSFHISGSLAFRLAKIKFPFARSDWVNKVYLSVSSVCLEFYQITIFGR